MGQGAVLSSKGKHPEYKQGKVRGKTLFSFLCANFSGSHTAVGLCPVYQKQPWLHDEDAQQSALSQRSELAGLAHETRHPVWGFLCF